MLLLAAALATTVLAPEHALLAPTANMARRPPRYVGLSVRLPPITKGPPTPKIYGPLSSARPLVMIDPGHGGHDPGARHGASGTTEKDVTLAVALAMRDELLKTGRIRVALTREDDQFLALEERYGLARDMGAALFISIHADASDEAGAHGATVYTLSDVASDEEAGRLAARENRANILNGIDLSGRSSAVSSILIDLTQRETMATSVRFAELLHRETQAQLPFRAPWHRSASLVVLRAPDIPSVLFETGYISNDSEAKRLSSAEERRKIAQGLARAITIFTATLGQPGAPAGAR
ncbi:MAG: N-acetylmuramoyl-L-alanine amidase [Sphingobium sp.]|nr:N-acetylmuramoyl-L-alanine amidase [Sphingobium sp.]